MSLKKCKECPYYKRLANIGQVTLHHYCEYYKSPYSLLRYQGKTKNCPPSFSEPKKKSDVILVVTAK